MNRFSAGCGCCDELCVGGSCIDDTWHWGFKLCASRGANYPTSSFDNDQFFTDVLGLFVDLGAASGSGVSFIEIPVTLPNAPYHLRYDDGTPQDYYVHGCRVTVIYTSIAPCVRARQIYLEFQDELSVWTVNLGNKLPAEGSFVDCGTGGTRFESTDASHFSMPIGLTAVRGEFSVSDPGC